MRAEEKWAKVGLIINQPAVIQKEKKNSLKKKIMKNKKDRTKVSERYKTAR